MISNPWPPLNGVPGFCPEVGKPIAFLIGSEMDSDERLVVQGIDVCHERLSVTVRASSDADIFFDRMLATDPRAWVRSKPWQKRHKGARK